MRKGIRHILVVLLAVLLTGILPMSMAFAEQTDTFNVSAIPTGTVQVFNDYQRNFSTIAVSLTGENVTALSSDYTVKIPAHFIIGAGNYVYTGNESTDIVPCFQAGSTIPTEPVNVPIYIRANTDATPGTHNIPIYATVSSGGKVVKTVPAGTLTVVVNTHPGLTVTSPTDNLQTTQSWVAISGQVELGAKVTVNGYPLQVDSNGNFRSTYLIPLGTTKLTFVATDSAGHSTTVTRTVLRPVVTIKSPTDNLQTNQSTVVVSGAAAPGATVTVNGLSVVLDGKGNFNTSVDLLEGNNAITVSGTDKYGQTTTQTRTVVYDAVSPTLNVDSPTDEYTTTQTWVAISGQVEVGAKLTVNGFKVAVDSQGRFSTTYLIQNGENILTFVATDAAGNSTSLTRIVYRD